MLLREKRSVTNLEAIMLGSAGLLDLLPEDDDYIERLRREFRRLSCKYTIVPMSAHEWSFSANYGYCEHTLRLVQLAACYHRNCISNDSLLNNSGKFAYFMFSAPTSDYWVELLSGLANKRYFIFLSQVLATKMAVNVLIPFIYTHDYIEQTDDYNMRAMELLYDLPGEENRYTKLWGFDIFAIHSAFESQGVIQLSVEYCRRGRCDECPLRKMIIRGGKYPW